MLYHLSGLTLIVLFVCLFAGCAAYSISPVTGGLATDVSGPLLVGTGINENAVKVGSASVRSIFGLFATGDASIRSIAQQAGITKIHYVDYHSHSILGLVATYTVYVYGE